MLAWAATGQLSWTQAVSTLTKLVNSINSVSQE